MNYSLVQQPVATHTTCRLWPCHVRLLRGCDNVVILSFFLLLLFHDCGAFEYAFALHNCAPLHLFWRAVQQGHSLVLQPSRR